MRLDAVDMIRAGGYEVIEAANADQAIRLLETRDDICVVFTDVDMPGSMDGLALAAAISTRWPPVRLIVTSGHSDVDLAALPDSGVFFPKPYRSSDITSTIRRMIPA